MVGLGVLLAVILYAVSDKSIILVSLVRVLGAMLPSFYVKTSNAGV